MGAFSFIEPTAYDAVSLLMLNACSIEKNVCAKVDETFIRYYQGGIQISLFRFLIFTQLLITSLLGCIEQTGEQSRK